MSSVVAQLKADQPVMLKVDLGNNEYEEVYVDPLKGPMCMQLDGVPQYIIFHPNPGGGPMGHGRCAYQKTWPEMGTTEKEVHLYTVAKRNKKLKERLAHMPPQTPIGGSDYLLRYC
mmetsp:Transcript_75912/g.235033  ORF Transcript_75912/g.235033 Transcript_75912/m.235033 type:complete len:116 (-) Transcript_75912:55-402(-)|eukprot:CAMPEP_0204565470 /NCGR_PEP_ID=MMETSP0661-20131031/35492_1 /ASSEMBLY_ACC=CAM_ASM_000606 /TAXON_ID=109239 /ORGANISM="Alexandrium margalefi, Strain AMGDE01CS-322" /LENGTH=115 /DNA_ID=CAMNT_0051573223 /DNA_START=71 /DNA_END=418 /DNA_ORIENTATION=-